MAWCRRQDGLYGPGLAAFGLDPGRLIVVRARTDKDVFWAMEEGLRCSRLVAVVGEVGALDCSAGRRLQLAARAGGAARCGSQRADNRCPRARKSPCSKPAAVAPMTGP